MTRYILPILVAVVCLVKSIGQVIIFVQHPDLIEKMPALVLLAQIVIIVLQLVATYLALNKPLLAVLTLVAVVLTHVIFFPLGVALASDVVLGPNYWTGFLISVFSNVAVALLAYASWRVYRRLALR